MGGAYNFSSSSKVNIKCVFREKPQKCLFNEVKCTFCDTIYIGNKQQNFNKKMGGHFFGVQNIFKNGQKPDYFVAHCNQNLNYNKLRTYLRNCVAFRLVKQINPLE